MGVNLKGYEIRESIFYKFNISSFLLSLGFLVTTIFVTRDDIQASYIFDKVNRTEDEYGIPILRYVNVFDVVFRSFNSPLKLYGDNNDLKLDDVQFSVYSKIYIFFCNRKQFLNHKILFLFLPYVYFVIHLVNNKFGMNNEKFFSDKKDLVEFLIYYKFYLFVIFLKKKKKF